MRSLAILMLALAAGCDKPRLQEVPPEELDGAPEASAISAGPQAPDGFPLPIMPGTEITSSTHRTQPGAREVFHVSLRGDGQLDRISDFYQRALVEMGLKVDRTDNRTARSIQTLLSAVGDTEEATVVVARDGLDLHSTAMITWTSKSGR